MNHDSATLIVRGVNKEIHNILKETAKERKNTINGLVLEAIYLYVAKLVKEKK